MFQSVKSKLRLENKYPKILLEMILVNSAIPKLRNKVPVVWSSDFHNLESE
jgi:hypothetical protein